jgi:hypothetical protein
MDSKVKARVRVRMPDARIRNVQLPLGDHLSLSDTQITTSSHYLMQSFKVESYGMLQVSKENFRVGRSFRKNVFDLP